MVTSQGASQTPEVASCRATQRPNRHSLSTGYSPQHPHATELLECTRQMSIPRAKYQMSIVLYMCIYKLICMYINPKGKIPGVFLKEGISSPFLAIPQRPLGLNSFTPPNGKDPKTGTKLAKNSQVTCLKYKRGGPYWDREGRRRHS